jgi:glycosyltransferase involved in cell wall biosynthesis
LFVGNDWRRKGVWYLILAFELVLNKNPDTVLVITGPPQEPFVSLAEKLKLNHSIIFAGNVDEETLAKYYAACDIFVLPSFHEGFSNTLIEAMAFGKPVVTTPVAGYPVVTNGEEGFIVRPGDHKSIAYSIIKLLENEDLYQNMCKNALKKAELYNWKEIAKKVLSIYESTLR